ncbi:MAG: ACT domain-containing protein [Erysipelotrichaceae bacterium]
MEKYLIVDKKILPDVYDKVVEARMLLQKGEVKQISQAVKKVGISRGTFYKYKDYVFAPSQNYMGRKAVISLTLEHRKGLLSVVLNTLSNMNANILTINQSIPIHEQANVVISLDMSDMENSMDEMMENLEKLDGISHIVLNAIE